ncbi:MAG: GAF domain-containing SpoIIE family protein phosphatase [Rubricoccaceae bacterium]|nr:GAF domain-containing SpoIIE family protein phosphatase [Rubricoccaceae bacterium]
MPDRFDLTSVVEASEVLNASLDLDFVLNNLLLVAMSRLLVGRGVVLLAEHERAGFWVAAAKGALGLSLGAPVEVATPGGVAEGEAVPEALRARGIALLLPIVHDGRAIGLVGLGAKATGDPFAPREVAFARSLVGVAAAAVHNARVAGQLQRVNLDLAARVQELDTLFELARAFAAALDGDEALKLLGFTLMGQFLTERHAVLLRPAEDAPYAVAAARGVSLDADALAALAPLDGPLSAGAGGPAEDLLGARRLALALPLRLQRGVLGLLLVGPRATGRPFTDADRAFLTALGTLALTAVERAGLVEARIEKERLEEELRLARSIQERLLPRDLPAVEGVDLAALALASRHVAGDYFDLLPLTSGRLLVAVADVSGKGAPAALLMANVQALLRLLAQTFDGTASLAAATARINRVVCENTEATAFITFFWGVLDAATGRFRYVNAGHNPPRLVRANGAVEPLEAGGLILGVLPHVAYEEGEATLAPGDHLALYTDGVTEALSPADEEYTEDRLDAVLVRGRDETAAALLDAVRDDVRAWADGRPFNDDLTLLVLKRTA